MFNSSAMLVRLVTLSSQPIRLTAKSSRRSTISWRRSNTSSTSAGLFLLHMPSRTPRATQVADERWSCR